MKKICKIMKKSMAFVFCLSMLCISANAASPFPDVPENAPYAEAAATLAELGVLQGDSQGNFNPDSSITRAQAAAVICRMIGAEEAAQSMTQQVFSDVPSSHWAVGYIAKAAELGIVGGYGDGNFGPSDPVTQEQIIKMLICAADLADTAEILGGYPNGYIEAAEMYRITDGTAVDQKSAAKRSTIAIWTYNAMFA